jgi:hypothetical protein
MAVKTFDEIVAGLQLSADEKKVFDNAIAKSPELKEGWLRQDDYSRRHTELQAKQKRLSELEEYEQKQRPWAETVYKRLESLQEAGIVDAEGNELWTSKKSELEKELEAARKQALAGDDMKPEEIDARVREIVKQAGGGLTREEITSLYTNETRKMVDEGFKEREAKFNTETIPFVAGFASAAAVVSARYERETGEKWTAEKQKEMYDLMGAEKNFDPFAIEDKLMAPFKKKKETEDLIQAEVTKRLAKLMPEGGGERFIPQGGDGMPLGALQKALDRSADGATDFESLIKSQAVKGGEALRSEGKF